MAIAVLYFKQSADLDWFTQRQTRDGDDAIADADVFIMDISLSTVMHFTALSS